MSTGGTWADLKGEIETYPLLPQGYFEEETERSLQEIEANARASPQDKLLVEVSALLDSVRIHNTWRSTAVLIYRNWLEHLFAQKFHEGKLVLGSGSLIDVPSRTRTCVKLPGKTGLFCRA